MDSTVIVAGIGLVTTLAATSLAPWTAGLVRRSDQLRAERRQLYGEIVEILTADTAGPVDFATVRNLYARLRLLGGSGSVNLMNDLVGVMYQARAGEISADEVRPEVDRLIILIIDAFHDDLVSRAGFR